MDLIFFVTNPSSHLKLQSLQEVSVLLLSSKTRLQSLQQSLPFIE